MDEEFGLEPPVAPRSGKVERVGDGESYKRIQELARNVQARMAPLREEARKLEVTCKPGRESCLDLTGIIPLGSGGRLPCQRIEKHPWDCALGWQRYRKLAGDFLRSVGYGEQETACFKHPEFQWDELSRTLLDYAEKWTHRSRKSSAIIGGRTGCGKTYSCLALLAHLAVVDNFRGKVFSAHRLLSRGIMSDEIDEAIACRILLLDDLGVEADTPAVKANITELLERRSNRPTLITTNLSLAQLGPRYGERIADRLVVFSPLFYNLPSKR